jgi:hypothetical protein
VNQTRPHCVNQMGKTHSKSLAAWHGRETARARHGNGMLCVNPPYEGQSDRRPVDVAVSTFPLSHPTTVYDKRWSPLVTTKCLSTVVICRYLSHAPFHLITLIVYMTLTCLLVAWASQCRSQPLKYSSRLRNLYLRTAQTARSVQCRITGWPVCPFSKPSGPALGGHPTSQPIVNGGRGLFHCELGDRDVKNTIHL